MEKLLSEFERHFVISGKSPDTIRAYMKDLRQFFRVNSVTKISEINREGINEWIFALRERGCAVGTIANHLWAIKAFLKWLGKEQHIKCYTWNIKIPYVPAPAVVEYLEPEELDQLFSTINIKNICGLRLRTFIEVMINTGLRPSEALRLERQDTEAEEIEIVGKGGKKRKVYFNDRAHHWVDRYLAARRDNHPALFLSHGTLHPIVPSSLRPVSHRHMQQEFRSHFLASGIRKNIVLHTLRHTYATTLLANGCPLDYVAVLLGHSKPETTRRHYVSIQHKHAKRAHFRYLSYQVVPEEHLNDAGR